MRRKGLRTFVVRSLALFVVLGVTWKAQAQDIKTPYPSMAPLDQYLMERNAEIALARNAAPESVSKDAKVLVLGRHGYETAVEGKNDFVCLVGRMWAAMKEAPSFGTPRVALRCVLTLRLCDPIFQSSSKGPNWRLLDIRELR